MNTRIPFGKHIFFTGERQVGKSTLIRRIIAANPQWNIGGYFTSWTNKSNHDAGLYLFPAIRKLYLDAADYTGANNQGGQMELPAEYANDSSLIARFGDEGKKVYPEVFDNLGVELLHTGGRPDIILMDEIGFLEERSELFKNIILEKLDDTIQIIGVLRYTDDKVSSFINTVRSHPNVEVINVTEDNRDSLLKHFI